jgi:flagellar biosynthesis activator protein FlaF
MHERQLEAYRAAQKSTMSGREIEAAALANTAMMLVECQDNWDAPDREQTLQEALRINQLLWSILQAELVEAANPLPKELRQDILNLSVFIDRKTIDVMIAPAPEKLTTLIDINLNLAAGLRGES